MGLFMPNLIFVRDRVKYWKFEQNAKGAK